MKKLIVILGPTATGKTKLAVKLANRFNGEIVSADSRQVYKEMNIGTGKDLKEYIIKTQNSKLKTQKKKKINYHLIDIIKPNTEFNVAKYKKLALKAIADIHAKARIPFLTGGTGLYISAVVDNYEIPKIKPNEKIRQSLKTLKTLNKINLLKKLDPSALDFVDINNPRRLDRALEVCLAGYKFSEVRKKGKPLFNPLILGIALSKKDLDKKINQRIDKMIKNGLIEETKKLIKKYGPTTAVLQTIGCQEIVDYLNNNLETPRQASAVEASLPQVIALIKTHSRQFARRQMIWFKRDKRIKWVKNYADAERIVKKFLQSI